MTRRNSTELHFQISNENFKNVPACVIESIKNVSVTLVKLEHSHYNLVSDFEKFQRSVESTVGKMDKLIFGIDSDVKMNLMNT